MNYMTNETKKHGKGLACGKHKCYVILAPINKKHEDVLHFYRHILSLLGSSHWEVSGKVFYKLRNFYKIQSCFILFLP